GGRGDGGGRPGGGGGGGRRGRGARRITASSTVMSRTMPAIAATQSDRLSAASKVGSLSSCMSLLKVRGSPFIISTSALSAPTTRPVLPRTSSAASGLRFCGMIELPGVKASLRRMYRNPPLTHPTLSSAHPDHY